ncbi:uncharacterized protein LOC135831214 isoform X2 [Planococcus citri]
MLKLHVVNLVGMINSTTILCPIIMYLCRDRIEAMIQLVDNILMLDLGSGFKKKKILSDAKKYFAVYLIPHVICCLVYSFASIPDVVLFFEEEKLSNSLYYAFPPPLVQKYASIWLFLIATGIIFIVFALTMAQGWSVFSLILYWNIICCAQFTSIKNYLHAGTCDLNAYTDEQVKFSDDWNEVFDCMLEHSIKEFQCAIRIIGYLRGLFEGIATMLVTNGFWIGMIALYTSFTDELLPLAKFRFLVGYMAPIIAVFLFYWSAQNLNNSVSAVSLSVYSTPWYRSVKIRKNVYIFLCKTQSMKDFAAFKAYGLLYNDFSRYLHGQLSYTNVLRKLTMK